MESCWHANSEMRPDTSEVVTTLASILERLPKDSSATRVAVPIADGVIDASAAEEGSGAKYYDLQYLQSDMVSPARCLSLSSMLGF